MQNKPTKIATFVALFCAYPITFAENQAVEKSLKLDEIVVSIIETSDALVNTNVDRENVFLKQAKEVKSLFNDKMDVNVSQLNGARSGGEGVNIRGLQANRVTSTVDGIPLPEAQEAKHFISYGSEFGRTDYVEVSGLRRADVQYAGSANSLSGSVNFTTLEPSDLLKGKNAGGFFSTGYNSVDNSIYGTLGGAVKVGAYQGILTTTIRDGAQTKNKGSNAGIGITRTEPNPADTQQNYALTKHYYKLNDQNRIGFTYEHQRKKTHTDLLSLTDTNIDAGTGTQTRGYAIDRVNRDRFSLNHDYNNDQSFVQNAKTQIYYQDAKSENYRYRLGAHHYRKENTKFRDQTYGINSHFMSYIDGTIPQILRYGFTYAHTKSSNHLNYERPAYANMPFAMLGRAYFNGNPSADVKQDKVTSYLEDEIAFGKWVVTPQLGFAYYRVKPTAYQSDVIATLAPKKQSDMEFTPKLSIEYRQSDALIPYVQYSRGVRTPSAQQLTSYFLESVTFRTPMGMQSATVAVVGNSNLKSETADNFEVGIKGENDRLQYLITGYYNRYHNFIDWVSKPTNGFASFIQYDNLDKAKVYGITADVKSKFFDDFYSLAGVSYARGKANNNGIETPINSIQPLKTKLGFGYEGEQFGANIQWTYSRGKADKDIEQSSAYLYNPTGSYSLFDLGAYWKPIANLTLTANVNNLFDKKYWNWNDISYLALLSKATQDQDRPASSIPMAITSQNADRFSAPGRNFNVGLRYEF